MGKFLEERSKAFLRFVKYWTWLNTAPEVKASKSVSQRTQVETPTRLQKARKDRDDELYAPDMPELDGVEYLVGYLFDVGPATGFGMGPAQISNAEIDAWARLRGLELSPWEASCVRRASGEYVSWTHRAADASCPSPIAPPELTDEDRARISKDLANAFRAMRKGPAK